MRLNERELAEASVIEEASEVTQVLMKIRRFGPYAMNPSNPEQGTNLHMLGEELGDLLGAIDFFLETHPEVDQKTISLKRDYRRQKLLRYNEGERIIHPFVLKEGKIYLHDMTCVGSLERTAEGFKISNDAGVPMVVEATTNEQGSSITALSFRPL